jgi:GntR family transcriptional regulator / MocR family aminotransferase
VEVHVSLVGRKDLTGEIYRQLRRASAAGVALLPLSMYAVDTPTRPGLVLGYGAIPTERLDEGLRRLRRSFAG